MQSLRRRVHTYLAVEAWPGRFASPINIAVMLLILVSLTADILETEEALRHWGPAFAAIELVVLVVFTAEYVLRAWSCVERERYSGAVGRLRYLVSFYALIDLLAILPSYVAVLGIDLTWLRTARLFSHPQVRALRSLLGRGRDTSRRRSESALRASGQPRPDGSLDRARRDGDLRG